MESEKTSPPSKPKPKPGVMRKVASGTSTVFSLKYFNPVNWVKDSSYERGSIVSTSWKRMRSAWRIKAADEYRKETFQEAKERLGVSESAVKKAESGLVLECYVLYVFSFLLLSFSAYYALNASVLGGISGVIVSFASATAAFVRAFRVWQIRLRRFGSFKEFTSQIDAWIP